MIDSGRAAITYHRKHAFLFLGLAAAGILILAVGLPGLELQPGLPIPGAGSPPAAAGPLEAGPAPGEEEGFPLLVPGALALGVLALLGLLAAALLRQASWKRVRWIALGLAAVYALYLLVPPAAGGAPPPEFDGAAGTPVPQRVYQTAPIGDPPRGLFWLAAGGLALAAAGTAAWLLRGLPKPPPAVDERLAGEAAAAIAAITAGEELQGVIIRCYLKMERAVREERGIARGEAVTAREFERSLAARGLPAGPLRQLTRLFEQARYSRQALEPGSEQQAVECLSAILQAGQGPARRAA